MRTGSYIRLSITILSLIIVFHLGIIVKVIPYDIAWGGRLKDDNDMYVFELISVFVNLILVAILMIKQGRLKIQLKQKIVNAILWVFLFVLILNTVGNLLSKTTFERVFSVATLVLALLIWNIVKKQAKRPANTNED